MLCCKFYSLVCTTSISKSRTSHSSLFFNPSLPLSLFLSLFLSLHFYQSTSRLTFFLLLSSFSLHLPSNILELLFYLLSSHPVFLFFIYLFFLSVARLAAIEDMAGMSILCSDKTGTLTMNKMEIQEETPIYKVRESYGICLTSYYIMLYYIKLLHIKSNYYHINIISYHIISCHIISYHIMSYYIVS